MKYDKIKNEIRSPLRYPGGKSRAVKKIIPLIPAFDEFREPFVGGGSVFIATKQRVFGRTIFKINDLNYDLYCFWNQLKTNGKKLINKIQEIKDTWNDGRALYTYYTEPEKNWSDFERGVRFFILNRITFSGTVDSGGYSSLSFKRRFTQSSIERLKPFPELLKNIIIKHGDYEDLVLEDGNNVFIFLDPPYFSTSNSKLYGKNGDLHEGFDHARFSNNMKKCPHKWLITYDNSKEIRELFSFANIYEWSLQYGMNNYKQSTAEIGEELFITNYELDIKKQTELISC